MTENLSYEERAKREKSPIQYRLYKGVKGNLGALRLNLKKPYTSDSRKVEGCVFIEMAPAIGPNLYDWDNQKMIMALSITDIPKIILYLRQPKNLIFKDGKLKLYHDKDAGTADKGKNVKVLGVEKPEDRNNFMFTMNQNETNGTKKFAACTVSPDEAIAIGILLQESISVIMAWNH